MRGSRYTQSTEATDEACSLRVFQTCTATRWHDTGLSSRKLRTLNPSHEHAKSMIQLSRCRIAHVAPSSRHFKGIAKKAIPRFFVCWTRGGLFLC